MNSDPIEIGAIVSVNSNPCIVHARTNGPEGDLLLVSRTDGRGLTCVPASAVEDGAGAAATPGEREPSGIESADEQPAKLERLPTED